MTPASSYRPLRCRWRWPWALVPWPPRAPAAIVRPSPATRKATVQYQLSRRLAGPFLHTIWRPTVTGGENIPASGGAILAANHQSFLDSVFLPLMLSRPVTFSAKAEYFTASGPAARLWAAYLRATNQLRMDRDGPRAAQD